MAYGNARLVELWQQRVDAISDEIAELDKNKIGGSPNIQMDVGPDHMGAIDHAGYRRSLQEELEKLLVLIHRHEDPWEVLS